MHCLSTRVLANVREQGDPDRVAYRDIARSEHVFGLGLLDLMRGMDISADRC